MQTPSGQIFYQFALPNAASECETPFQGFSPGLLSLYPLMSGPLTFPSDIADFTLPYKERLTRRRLGYGGWCWTPLELTAIISSGAPSSSAPFTVIFSAEEQTSRELDQWIDSIPIKPLHFCSDSRFGADPNNFTLQNFQEFLLRALNQAKLVDGQLEIKPSSILIRSWRPMRKRQSSLRLHSHNVTLPNELVLVSSGQRAPSGKGQLNNSPNKDYVDGIGESVKAVRELQKLAESDPVHFLFPPRPDLILFAPASYKSIQREMRALKFPAEILRAVKFIERQKGYTSGPIEESHLSEEDVAAINFIRLMRALELKIQTVAVGLRGASTLSATIRLAPGLNLVSNLVGQFARHLRSYDDIPPDRKTAKVFRLVQDALLKNIPAEHLALITGARFGVKLVADAPLEWLPINGLPLSIRLDTSRINVTPGNLLIQQLGSITPLHIPASEFRNYLLVSMFDDDDALYHQVNIAMDVVSERIPLKASGTRARPNSVDEFVEVVNAHDGPILIVDCHGSHSNDPDVGGLVIGGKSVDIWSLHHRIKVPPIVILLACDTHPFDRSHATVANGFLRCGAIAVLASVLPIRGTHAAIFIARLMNRAINFGGNLNEEGRSFSWANAVGSSMRMQLAHDVVRDLERREMISENQSFDLHFQANMDINNRRSDWFELLSNRCREICSLTEEQWQTIFDDILAGSDVIRYVHVGNPEAILISDTRQLKRVLEEHKWHA